MREKSFYSAGAIKTAVYDDWRSGKNVFEIKIRNAPTALTESNTVIVGQQGLQVLPMMDPETSQFGESTRKLFAVKKPIKFPCTIYDVKFPYEITLCATFDGKSRNLTVKGPGVAPIYYGLLFAEKGILPSDCVPEGKKGAPAGFSHITLENEDDWYRYMSRWLLYAVGNNKVDPMVSRKLVPIVDADGVTKSYNITTFDGDHFPVSEKYKKVVDRHLAEGCHSRLITTDGESAKVMLMALAGWRKNNPNDNINDPNYKAISAIAESIAKTQGGKV